MPTSQTRLIPASLSDEPLPEYALAYYSERLRNRIFSAVLEAFVHESEQGNITKALLARRIGKEPAQVSRWFSGPSNWTLDTISLLLLGIGAELDPTVAFFADRAKPNYAHPVALMLGDDSALSSRQVATSTSPVNTIDMPDRTVTSTNSPAHLSM